MRQLLPALPLFAFLSLPAAQTSHFREATDDYAITFEHTVGNDTFGMGGGVACIDLDVDGDDDLLFAGGGPQQAVLRNDGGTFVDISAQASLLTPNLNVMGVMGADFDQDGLPDLYLYARGNNYLFRNLGNLQFSDVSATEQVEGSGWSSAASFADFDLDGDLDLYVGNYIQVLSFPYHIGGLNNLYLNEDGAGPQPFQEVAVSLGVEDSGVFGPLRDPDLAGDAGPPPIGEPTAGCALSVATLDYDEDGDPDLQIGNDFGWTVLGDRLFRNDIDLGSGLAFTDVTDATMFDQSPVYNMGVNGADYDHDGDWDFYLSNLGDNVLLRNDDGVFLDVTAQAGPLEGVHTDDLLLTSWGTAWIDFDHDGWEDLFVVNGFVPAAAYIANSTYSPDALWKNQGDGTFLRDSAPQSGLDGLGVGRGLGVLDVNDDGAMDLLVVNNNAFFPMNVERRSRLYLNEAAPGNWLKLRLAGRTSNLEGIGARIEARAGDQLWKRQVLADPIYLSCATRTSHFGVGDHEAVDLRVNWPSGIEQKVPNLATSQSYEVAEPFVLVDAARMAVRPGVAFTLSAKVRNASDIARSATLAVRFYEPGTANVVQETLRPVSLIAGESRIERWNFPNAGGAGQWDVAVYAFHAGALDGEKVTVTLR